VGRALGSAGALGRTPLEPNPGRLLRSVPGSERRHGQSLRTDQLRGAGPGLESPAGVEAAWWVSTSDPIHCAAASPSQAPRLAIWPAAATGPRPPGGQPGRLQAGRRSSSELSDPMARQRPLPNNWGGGHQGCSRKPGPGEGPASWPWPPIGSGQRGRQTGDASWRDLGAPVPAGLPVGLDRQKTSPSGDPDPSGAMKAAGGRPGSPAAWRPAW